MIGLLLRLILAYIIIVLLIRVVRFAVRGFLEGGTPGEQGKDRERPPLRGRGRIEEAEWQEIQEEKPSAPQSPPAS